MSRKKLFVIFLCFLGISFFLYGNSIKGGFIYDDTFFSDRNELKSADHLLNIWLEPYLPANPDAGAYRPFAIFTFSLNFIVFGSSPISFHITSIILNAVATFLVFLLTLKIFNDKHLAIFSSLLFAFFPIHTETVAFMKSRDEILATILILLSWLLFIKSTEGPNNYKGVIASICLFFLSVLAKETFILGPIIFLAVLWIKDRSDIKSIFDKVLLFVPAYLIYLWMRISALGTYAFGSSMDDFVTNPLLNANMWERVWTPFKVVFMYLIKIFIPYNLSASYHFNQVPLVNNPLYSAQAIMGMIFISLFILLTLHKKTRLTPLGVGSLIFLISYITISKFIFQATDLVAERWIYFPSFGLSMIAGFLFTKIYNLAKEFTTIIFTIILIFYGGTIISRNNVWLTSDSLFNSMAEDSPNSAQGYLMLSSLYLHHKPMNQLEGWILGAYKIAPGYTKTLNLMGLLEGDRGNFGLAEEYFLESIEADPLNKLTVEQNLGLLYHVSASFYAKKGEYDKAIIQLTKLTKLFPNEWKAYSFLGQAYSLKKDYKQAAYFYTKALSLNPNNDSVEKLLKEINAQ